MTASKLLFGFVFLATQLLASATTWFACVLKSGDGFLISKQCAQANDNKAASLFCKNSMIARGKAKIITAVFEDAADCTTQLEGFKNSSSCQLNSGFSMSESKGSSLTISVGGTTKVDRNHVISMSYEQYADCHRQ